MRARHDRIEDGGSAEDEERGVGLRFTASGQSCGMVESESSSVGVGVAFNGTVSDAETEAAETLEQRSTRLEDEILMYKNLLKAHHVVKLKREYEAKGLWSRRAF